MVLAATASMLGLCAAFIAARTVSVEPWYGDQALFAYAAGLLGTGGVLYVDVWDIKQPGVIWAHALGDAWFGSAGAGTRWFEFLLLLISATGLALALRVSDAPGFAVWAAPLLSVGGLYAWANASTMAQVETLVVFPLSLSLLCLTVLADGRGLRAPAMGYLLGFLAALVGVLKLILMPVVLASILVYGLACRWSVEVWAKTIARAVAAGALVFAAIALHAYRSGSLDEALWTWFVYPLTALREVEHAGLRKLLASTRGFLREAWPSVAMALPGVVYLLGPWSRGNVRLRAVGWALVGWIAAAGLMLWAQRISAWPYHFGHLFFPVAGLAAIGIGAVGRAVAGWHRGLAAPVMAAALLVAGYPILRDVPGRLAGPAGVSQERFEGLPVARASAEYVAFRMMSPEIRASLSGNCEHVYVFGDPVLLLLLGTKSSLATHGWMWEFMPDAHWRQLLPDFERARPAAVFVSRVYRPLLEDRAPAIMALLRRDYVERAVSSDGRDALFERLAPPVGTCTSTVPFVIPPTSAGTP